MVDRRSPNIFVDASLSDNGDQIIPMESLPGNQNLPVGEEVRSLPRPVLVRRARSEALLSNERQPLRVRIVPDLEPTPESNFLEVPLTE
jgi:hypothetical protein